MIRRILVYYLLLCLVLGFLVNAAHSDTKAKRLIHIGDIFPNTRLNAPKADIDIEYLGLGNRDTFALGEIKAELVLVELLSIFCMTCQMQAHFYNKLFDQIEADPITRGRIKMIGVGVGNNHVQLEHFKKQFKVPFPLFPDPQMKVHQILGGGRTPFTILIRMSSTEQYGVVARTHLGAHNDYRKLFDDMQALMTLDLSMIQKKGQTIKPEFVTVKPLMPESDLRAKVKEAMEISTGPLSDFGELVLEGFDNVYTGMSQNKGKESHVFAEVISRPPTCDLCHDVYFFYIFDEKGKILQFVPLQLTKYGNKPWLKNDIEKMRMRLVNHTVTSDFSFNPEIDAVSSATITSMIIFHSLSRSKHLYQKLKEKGLVE